MIKNPKVGQRVVIRTGEFNRAKGVITSVNYVHSIVSVVIEEGDSHRARAYGDETHFWPLAFGFRELTKLVRKKSVNKNIFQGWNIGKGPTQETNLECAYFPQTRVGDKIHPAEMYITYKPHAGQDDCFAIVPVDVVLECLRREGVID